MWHTTVLDAITCKHQCLRDPACSAVDLRPDGTCTAYGELIINVGCGSDQRCYVRQGAIGVYVGPEVDSRTSAKAVVASLTAIAHGGDGEGEEGEGDGEGQPSQQYVPPIYQLRSAAEFEVPAFTTLLVPGLAHRKLELSVAQKQQIRRFVKEGGVFVALGDYHGYAALLLGSIFGKAWEGGGSHLDASAQPSDNATSFFGGAAPSSLPAINAVWGLDALSVGKDDVLYMAGNRVAVAGFLLGKGRAVYLGYDWYAAEHNDAWALLLGATVRSAHTARAASLGLAPTSAFSVRGMLRRGVGVYMGTHVDVTGEAQNLLEGIKSVGHLCATAFEKTEWGADGYTYGALIVPELEKAELAVTLRGRDQIRDFVQRGGVFVISGDFNGYGAMLINNLFDKVWMRGPHLNKTVFKDQSASGPDRLDGLFGKAPASLPATNAVWGLMSSSIRTSERYYEERRNTGDLTAVAAFAHGTGAVIYVGYDWYKVEGSDPWNALLGVLLGHVQEFENCH